MKDLESLIALIKEHASLRDILIKNGKIRGSLPEEQFGCMFHGADRKKSSRYYKETDTAYCWVCKEKWDVISFIMRMEGMTFPQTLNYIVRTYGIDISKLPDTPEAEAQRIQKRDIVKLDDRKLKIEKLSYAINAVRNEMPEETYAKFVYTYMVLKYMTPDESFTDMYQRFKEAMLRVFEKQNKIRKASICQTE